MELIKATDISYTYDGSSKALANLSFTVEQGKFIALLGHNGCGKTTLARHLNGLLTPEQGTLTVAGLDVRDRSTLWQLRQKCGMVFQNPDNQFVSSLVEEDLAFGLRNFGVAEEEIPARIAAALAAVDMAGFEKRCPQLLSGGQKQRIAIAGVLAVDPEIIVFDEVTSMLDPQGRQEVMQTVRRLHQLGKTVIMISHNVEEAVMADRVMLVHDGCLLGMGTPKEVLTDLDLLARTGLLPPLPVQAYYDLKAAGCELPFIPLTNAELSEELAEVLCR